MLLVKQLMFSSLFAPYGCQIREKTPPYAELRHSKYSHTHCGERMIISQEMTAEQIYDLRRSMAVCSPIFLQYFNIIEHI